MLRFNTLRRQESLMTIDSSSIISNKTKIHPSVNVGPFCIIGDDVEIELTDTINNAKAIVVSDNGDDKNSKEASV